MKTTRRQFITGAAAAVVAIGFGAVQQKPFRSRVPPEMLRPDTLMRFLDRAAIVRLGQLYLRHVEPQRSPGELVEALQSALPPAMAPEDGRWRAALGAASRSDFSAGRVVALDGWVLSQTEARQCALLAALAGEAMS